MHDLEEKLKPVCEIKEKLVAYVKEGLESDCLDIEDAGEIVDMIKDLAKTEKSCYEAAYFKAVVKAMDEADEDEEAMAKLMMSGMMGYNPNHSARTGRFISGRSGRRGFRAMPAPMGDMVPPYMMGDGMDIYGIGDSEWDGMMDTLPHKMRMGYPISQSGSERHVTTRGGNRGGRMGYEDGWDPMMQDPDYNPRHGEAYNKFRQARRHYTETHSPEHKKEMDQHANEHVMDTIATMRELWKDADVDLKKRMKQDFTNLMSEMTV